MFKRTPTPFVTCLILILVGVAAIGYSVHVGRAHGALLRADPDAIPANPLQMRYAVAGKSVYRSRCLACHRENGTGDSLRGVPSLSDGDWLYGTGLVSEIERVVTYGIRSNNPKAWNLAVMPAFARPRPSPTNAAIVPLAPDQVADVIEFLKYKQQRPAAAEAVQRGAVIYNGVGGCYDCHSPDAAGDDAIGAPNLIDNITLYGNGDSAALYDSIANGRHGVCPAWVNVLSPLAIREVALYVYALSHSTSR